MQKSIRITDAAIAHDLLFITTSNLLPQLEDNLKKKIRATKLSVFEKN